MSKPSTTLLALSSAAALLPGIAAQSSADTAPGNSTVGYRYSQYKESDNPQRVTIGTSNQRYEIKVHQFFLTTPVSKDYSVTFDAQHETLSGASPWFTDRDADGLNKVVMSGASIKETRDDYAVNVRRFSDWGNTSVTASYSTEDDYRSSSVSTDLSVNLNQKHTTLNLSASYSDDRLNPTQGSVPIKVVREEKKGTSIYAGISQIINRISIFSVGLNVNRLSGYLTDPYKLEDSRPDKRMNYAAVFGYRYFLSHQNAAAHIDYRYYWDDWEVKSHTLDLHYLQNLGDNLQLIPGFRFYSQGQAEFFANNHDTNDRYYADDYRLSSYGATSYSLKLVYKYKSFDTYLSVERYESDAVKYGLKASEESPGIISFSLFSIGFDRDF